MQLGAASLPIGCGLILNRSVTLVENTETFEKPKCFVETATPSQYANSVQISFDEFLKLLEFSDRRPSSRCETAETRRVFNFLPRPIRSDAKRSLPHSVHGLRPLDELSRRMERL